MGVYTVQLKETHDVADGTRMFVFEKPEGYQFSAGQYVALTVMVPEGMVVDNKGLSRSLSVASAPCEKDIAFVMREGESSFKKICWQMRPGDVVTITKAVGFFTLEKEDVSPIVFLVGGIGITPVRSILKQAESEQDNRSFTLFYANRFLKDAAFQEELQEISLPQFRLVAVLSKSPDVCAATNDERGYICGALVQKYVSEIASAWYYLVGSPQFSEAMEKMLIELGVPKERCKKDPFTGIVSQSAK
ncbi:MAG: FAD-dependent oxidoreductase [Candidatus Moranbacteria bacterium]|nr:FAD-dependent oxidoreductase [Candidatus Moranbacteria bacterium]